MTRQPDLSFNVPRHRRFSAVLAAIGLILLANSRVAGQAADPREQLIEQRLRLLKAQSDLAVWEKIASDPVAGADQVERFNDSQIKQELTKAFTSTASTRKLLLDELFPKVIKLNETAIERWRTTTRDSVNFQEEVKQAQALYEFDWRDNQPPRFKLGWLGWAVAGSWLLMLTVCIGLCLHELRRGIRHARRVGGILLALGLVIPLGSCSGSRDSGSGAGIASIDEEIASTKRQIDETEVKLLTTQKDANAKRDKALNTWKAWLPEGLGADYVAAETAAAEQTRDLLLLAAFTEALAKDARAKLTQVQADRKRLDDLIEQSRSQNSQHRLLRIVGCIVLGVSGIVPLFVVRRKIAKRLKKESRICPRCLSEGTLKSVRTTAKDQQGKEMTFLECSKCRYRFPSSHLRLPRICFPTVGIKSSGKTQWLLTALDQVSNGQVPVPASIETDMSQVSAQIKRFLTMLKQRVPPPASVFALPEPLNFVLRDADTWGPTRSMASLFDFAGKTMDEKVYDSEFRERALKMDGFLLFVDPTQLDPDPNEGPEALLDRQKDQLANFYLELCKVRGLEDGAVLNVPVAVCVTKMDLLVNYNPIGEQARPKIAELRKLKPEGRLSLELIRKRSHLCKSMLKIMFQGWEIDASLRKRFGGNITYFPMSSVSMVDAELGEKDLKRRTLAPYGILEPFLWLLHMHGFCLFEDV